MPLAQHLRIYLMEKELIPTLKLSLDMTKVLSRMEYDGLRVNLDTLQEIKDEYQREMDKLQVLLERLAKDAMGDTPINLASPDDRSMLLYSCKVRDKGMWAKLFNLGTEKRGATVKQKMRKRLKKEEFKKIILNWTDVVYKTEGECCAGCLGNGRVRPVRKDGTPSKALRICKPCDGTGVIYRQKNTVAGFKLLPRNAGDVASAGFKTDKVTLESRVSSVTGVAKDFIKAYTRYNALRTYMSTFIEGIENNVDEHGFIHPEFMQCVTATGRLSSRNPNFQNMPRGSTFAIRKVIESRFEGGSILEGDYSQLEFRVAGFLSKDKQVYDDVKKGTDVHSYTAEIIGCSRQEAKAHTFKPLYGGVSGTDAQQRYYNTFKTKYKRVSDWHDELQKEAVRTKQIKLPSGRQFAFPDARWTAWGTATNRTAICNYPVQGFATADLLPLALIELHRKMSEMGLESLICNTVHDSIVLDVHPNEKEDCIRLLSDTMRDIPKLAMSRYGIDYDMPVGIELKIGQNWLDLNPVEL